MFIIKRLWSKQWRIATVDCLGHFTHASTILNVQKRGPPCQKTKNPRADVADYGGMCLFGKKQPDSRHSADISIMILFCWHLYSSNPCLLLQPQALLALARNHHVLLVQPLNPLVCCRIPRFWWLRVISFKCWVGCLYMHIRYITLYLFHYITLHSLKSHYITCIHTYTCKYLCIHTHVCMYACTYACVYIYIPEVHLAWELPHIESPAVSQRVRQPYIYRIDAATAMVAWGKPNAIHFSQVITVFIV